MTATLDPRPETIPGESTGTDGRRSTLLMVVSAIILASLAAAIPFLGADGAGDGSPGFAEEQRMLALASASVTPIDASHEPAEARRMASLAPQVDGSHEVAELDRMHRLSPVEDTSHEVAEQRRMQTLQP